MKNYDKFFEQAKKQGITDYELYIRRSATPLKFETFRGELSSFTSSDVTVISARGIVNGKMGYASSEVLDETAAEFLAKEVKQNAEVVDSKEKAVIFGGSKNYSKFDTYGVELEKIPVTQKIQFAHDVEKKIRGCEYIIESETYYGETVTDVTIINSKGVNLSQKNNYYVFYASAVAKKGEEVKTEYAVRFGNDYSKLNVEEIVKEAVDGAVSKFGGQPCESKTYPCVIDRDVMSSFIMFVLNSTIAENVQKHSSVFEGKLNQKVASEKVTLMENPLTQNCMGRYFDDEGVATFNKAIIENGVLKTYLYNLETAEKDQVAPTGNGYKNPTGKIGTSFNNAELKQGSLTLDQLFEQAKDGVYINEVQGLHAGMNPTSGNFSLQASGFMIEKGKKGQAVSLITVAGNLFDMFKNVVELANDGKLSTSGILSPSVLIEGLAISGK